MSVDGKQRSNAYWDERSKGYNLATRLALNNSGNAVRRNILHFLDGDRRLRILDAGCGAGYAAVIAAQMGHEVTALDFSARMLERVESNAGKYGVDIETVKGDVCSMPFDDARFDLVISKDTLWCIDDPMTAYCEFMRVLRPGGHILVMDGNWYLDLFDDDYRRRREYVGMKSGKRGSMHANTNIDNVDFDIMRDLARDMPLSRVRRPAWDVSTLLGLGAEVGEVRSLDDDSYMTITADGMMELTYRFVLFASSPGTSSGDGVRYDVVDEAVIDRMSDRIAAMDTSCIGVFKALSDDRRLRMCMALHGRCMSSGQLAQVMHASPSLISHNLRVLRDCGLVVPKRNGKEVMYTLSDRNLFESLLDSSGDTVNRWRKNSGDGQG